MRIAISVLLLSLAPASAVAESPEAEQPKEPPTADATSNGHAANVLLPSRKLPQPLVLDLTPERLEYEAKAHPRIAGLALLGGALALGATSIYGYSTAIGAKSELLAQQVPIDRARRQELLSRGEIGNAVGTTGVLLGLGAAVASAYFLSVSF